MQNDYSAKPVCGFRKLCEQNQFLCLLSLFIHFHLFERQREKKRSSISWFILKCLLQPWLAQAKARSQGIHLGHVRNPSPRAAPQFHGVCITRKLRLKLGLKPLLCYNIKHGP